MPILARVVGAILSIIALIAFAGSIFPSFFRSQDLDKMRIRS